jgi:hypothetical protein
MKVENSRARILHLRKLKELVSEYSNQGYEIFADLQNYPPPRLIGNFRPDLIAKKGDREVIIEIASRSEMDKIKTKLEKLAEYADKTKDIRFDIVLTNPRTNLVKDHKSESQRRLLRHVWQYLLKDVNASYRRKQYNTTFYLLYDLLKSMLEEQATAKGIVAISGRYTLTQIIESLLRSGLLNLEDYKSVKKLAIARNRMVHHGKEAGFEIDKAHLADAKELANALVKNIQ